MLYHFVIFSFRLPCSMSQLARRSTANVLLTIANQSRFVAERQLKDAPRILESRVSYVGAYRPAVISDTAQAREQLNFWPRCRPAVRRQAAVRSEFPFKPASRIMAE